MAMATAAAAALTSGSLQPQPPDDSNRLGPAALLALVAHGGLIVALTLGLDWRWRTPDTLVSAELWSAVPQQAAPAPMQAPPVVVPTPAPKAAPKPAPIERRSAPPAETQPHDAQIAIEKAERQKMLAQARDAEQKRLQAAREDKLRQAKLRAELQQAERLKNEMAAQREVQAAEDRLARQREANLARIRGLANVTSPAAAAATDSAQPNTANSAAPSAAYAGRIQARIKPNIVLTSDVSGNPVTEVEVRSASDGAILGRRILKSSGNPVWDDTVLRAIDRTEMLPRDVDGRVPATLILVFPRRE